MVLEGNNSDRTYKTRENELCPLNIYGFVKDVKTRGREIKFDPATLAPNRRIKIQKINNEQAMVHGAPPPPWAPRPPNRPNNELPSIAVIGGTGRMGVHLCAAWAQGGYDVTMCSRNVTKAQDIVDSLLSGNGYMKKVEGKNAGQGDYCVPPCDAKDW